MSESEQNAASDYNINRQKHPHITWVTSAECYTYRSRAGSPESVAEGVLTVKAGGGRGAGLVVLMEDAAVVALGLLLGPWAWYSASHRLKSTAWRDENMQSD